MIDHRHLARLAVEFEKYQAFAVRLRVAQGDELDDQRFAWLDVHAHLLARLHAEEEDRGRQHAGVRILLLVGIELREHTWIEKIAEDLALGGVAVELPFEL